MLSLLVGRPRVASLRLDDVYLLQDRSGAIQLMVQRDSLPEGVAAAALAARAGAKKTAEMQRAKAGRASYLSAEQLSGHIDPGAEAVALLFEALSRLSDK